MAAYPRSRFARRFNFRLIMLFAFAASPAAADDGLRHMRPSEATQGTMLFESAEAGKFIEAPLLVTDVEIEISGPIARTKVTQRFENTSDRWVEGVYVFPLPDEAAVDTLKMQIGDRFIEGRIEEKKKAKEIYEAAKAQGKKASLVEQERANIFTNSVANIGPGETIVVQIEYQESVRIDGGEFRLRFPMVVAPRYNPAPNVMMASLDAVTGWATSDPVPDRARISPPVLHPSLGDINPVHLTVSLAAGFPLGAINSPYHPVRIDRKGEDGARLTLADGEAPANRDFELTWRQAANAPPSAALFTETIEGERYYIMMVTPPAETMKAETPAREVTFILDTSGSMGGESIRQARKGLLMAIRRLKSVDAFNIIEFNSDMQALFTSPVPATPANVNRALSWVEKLDARGGTEMLPALRFALHQQSDNARLKQVVFLTDGAIGNEEQLFETIAAERGDARVFTIGIGSAPNSLFMSRAAELGQGTFTHIGAVNEVSERMGALLSKLESPAIVNIAAGWPEGSKAEVWPAPIPDLYKGETLVVAARADAKDGVVWVSGATQKEAWKVGLPLDKAVERKGVSKLWAREKIKSLELVRARRAADEADIDAAILKVALAHQLVSRLTSLIAVDIAPSRPQDETLTSEALPLNLPAGWDFDKVFGEGVIIANAAQLPAGLLKESKPANSEADAANPERSIDLPQTATEAELKLLMGALLVLAAFGLFAATRDRKGRV